MTKIANNSSLPKLDSIKSQPSLINKVASNFWDGLLIESHLLSRRINTSPNVKKLFNYVQKPTTPQTREEATPISNRLKELALEGLEPQEPHISELEDPARLFALSRLREANVPKLPLELLSHATNEIISEFIDHIYLVSEQDKNAFKKSARTSKTVAEIIKLGDDGAAKTRILNLSKRLREELAELEVGETFIYSGTLAKDQVVPSMITKYLPKQVAEILSPDGIEQVIAKVKRECLGDFAGSATDQFDEMQATKLAKSIRDTMQKALPNAVNESITKDIREYIVGTPTQTPDPTLAEKVYDALLGDDFEKVIESHIRSSLTGAKNEIMKQLLSTTKGQLNAFPPTIKTALEIAGITPQDNEAFYLKIIKENGDNYSISLHTPEHTYSAHVNTLELFNETFFFRLISYEVWPQIGYGCSYSLATLLDSLFQTVSISKGKKTELQRADHLGCFTTYLSQNHSNDEIEKLEFDLRYTALVGNWKNLTDTACKTALNSLVTKGIDLFKRNLIDEQTFKTLYATTHEIEEKLREKSLPGTLLKPSIVLPPIAQQALQTLLQSSGVTEEHVESVREAALSVFGIESEPILDEFFKELLPKLAAIEATKARPPLFSTARLDTYKQEIRSFRFSLLHITRTYFLVTQAQRDAIALAAKANIWHGLLTNVCPAIVTASPLGAWGLSLLAVYIGPEALKALLPVPLREAIDMIWGLVEEVSAYVYRRLTLLVLRPLLVTYIGKESIADVTHLAKQLTQQTTRGGELTFELENNCAPYSKVSIHVDEPSQVIELEEIEEPEEITAHKPLISSDMSLPQVAKILTPKIENKELIAEYHNELNSYIKSLPIPQKEAPYEGNAIEALEHLNVLMCALRLSYKSCQVAGSIDTTLSFFTLCALTDSISMHIDSSIPPNIHIFTKNMLANYLVSKVSKVTSIADWRQLEALLGYYDIDIIEAKRFIVPNENLRPSIIIDGYGTRRDIQQYNNLRIYPAMISGHIDSFSNSAEGKYFTTLLENANVKEALIRAGIGPDAEKREKLSFLFRDPPQSLLESEVHPLDQRRGILPREYYALRLASLFALEAIEWRSADPNPHSWLKDGLIFPKPKPSSWWFSEYVVKPLHKVTFDVFKEFVIEAPNLKMSMTPRSWCAISWGLETQHDTRIRPGIFLYEFVSYPGARNADQIMAKGTKSGPPSYASRSFFDNFTPFAPLSFYPNKDAYSAPEDLTEEETRLAEMTTTFSHDQLSRTLSFFSRSLHLLQKEVYLNFFTLSAQNHLAMRLQLSENPKFTQTCGHFFTKALTYLRRNEHFSSYSFMSKFGQEFKDIAELYGDCSSFPDFREGLRDLKTTTLSLTCLGASHQNTQPSSSNRQALIDIARVDHRLRAPSKHRVQNSDAYKKSTVVVKKWEEHIAHAMNDDIALRNEIIFALLKDDKVNVDPNVSWKGKYPRFSSGTLTCHLGKKCTLLENKNNILDEACSFLRKVCPSSGEATLLSNGLVAFKDANAVVDLHAQRVVIERESKKYTWSPLQTIQGVPRELASYNLFVEENSRSIACMRGSKIAYRFPIHKTRDNELFIDFSSSDLPPREVDLKKERTSLGLLSWFCPLDKLKVSTKLSDPKTITQIEMPEQRLSFEVVDGKAICKSSRAYGYWISPNQKTSATSLFPKSLLLENSSEKKRLLIQNQTPQMFLGQFLLEHIAALPLSPLLHSTLTTLAEKQLSEDCPYMLTTLDIDEDDRLIAHDARGWLLLAFTHFIKGNEKECLEAVTQLEQIAKQQSLEGYERARLDAILLSFALSDSPLATQAFLRLSASLEENLLLHTGCHSSYEPVCEHFEHIRWICLQKKLSEYYVESKASYLNEYDELFLFETITRTTSELSKETLGKLNDYLGVGKLIESSLMLPSLAKRYYILRQKYDNDSMLLKGAKALTNGYTKAQSIPSFNPLALIPRFKQKESLLDSVSEAFAQNAPIKAAVKGRVTFTSLCEPKKPIDELPVTLEEISPSDILDNFAHYYRLARREHSDKALSDAFIKTLPLLRGSYRNDKITYIIETLNCAATSHFPWLPKADTFNEYYEAKRTPPKKESAKQRFHSLFDKVNTLQRAVAWASAKGITHAALPVAKSILNSQATIVQNAAITYCIPLAAPLAYAKPALGLYHAATTLISDAPNSSEIVRESDASLSRALLQSITQRESGIDETLHTLFTTFFEKTELEDEKQEELPPFENFDELNETLKDYYSREQPPKRAIQLKEGLTSNELKNELKRFKEEVMTHLQSEREAIEELVNKKPPREKTTLELFLEKKNDEQKREFESIFLEFIRGNCENEEVKERLYLYMVMASRFSLLFKSLDKNETQIGRELLRKRAYSFAGASEKSLRAKLAFEMRTQLLLWEKQALQFDRLNRAKHDRLLVEMIMGGGKTFFGIPLTDYIAADKKTCVINVWPKPLAPTNIATVGKQAISIYGQTANTFTFSKNLGWSAREFRAAKLLFKRATENQEQINTTKEDLQALELVFIEMCIDGKDQESIGHIKEILALIRKHGKAIIDEAHEAFRPDRELNYPSGKKRRLPEKEVEVLEAIMLELAKEPLLTFMSKNPEPLSQERFKEEIAPKLARRLVALDRFALTLTEQEEAIIYVLGKCSETVPSSIHKHKKRSELALIKGALTAHLPIILDQIMHSNYSQGSHEKFAKPSEGNVNPSEEANIRCPYEAHFKTFLLFLNKKLTIIQARIQYSVLREKAKAEASKYTTSLEETPTARFFANLFKGHSLNPGMVSHELYEKMRVSAPIITGYVKDSAAKEIYYYTKNLRSNPQNAGAMFASFYSDSGTPPEGTMPEGTELLADPGTTGESIDVYEQQNGVHTLKSDSPQAYLDEIIKEYIESDHDYTALIDRGALFRGVSNREVADRLLKYIEEKRNDLEGVVFFNSEKELVILQKGSSKPVPFTGSTIPKNRRLTYFDESHTYGADVPQKEGAKAVLTCGEKTVLKDGLLQAEWRMRGLKNLGQSITTLVPKNLALSTKRDVIIHCQNNSEAAKKNNWFEADKQKISNIARRAVLDQAIFSNNIKTSCAVIKEFNDLLVETLSTDPYQLFGLLDAYLDPNHVLYELKKTFIDRINQSSLFTPKEKCEITTKLQIIGGGEYPKEVHVYREGNSITTTSLDAIGQSQQVEQQAEEEEQVTQEVEQEAENVVITDREPRIVPHTFINWPNIELTNLDWFTFETLKSRLKKDHEIADSISKIIYTTNNFTPKHHIPFGLAQKPLQEVLIIEEGNKHKILLLDPQEVNLWRQILKNEKEQSPNIRYALYDITLKATVATGKHKPEHLDHNQLLPRAITQLKLLRGDTKFDEKEKIRLSRWLKKHSLEQMVEFTENVRKHHKIEPFEGSDLHLLTQKLRVERIKV